MGGGNGKRPGYFDEREPGSYLERGFPGERPFAGGTGLSHGQPRREDGDATQPGAPL